MDSLLEYFSSCTNWEPPYKRVCIGAEIETDFVMIADGTPITQDITDALLTRPGVNGSSRKLELGRQKIELAVEPQSSVVGIMKMIQEGLRSLYYDAFMLGARPVYHPELRSTEQLLYVNEDRDALWVDLDGKEALEELCRCSSVQLTIDYGPNNLRWENYIQMSNADYRADRYGGPMGFRDLEDYVEQLKKHKLVMHDGQPCNLYFDEVENPDIDLFLRSVWWHYRLRRYGDTLALEIRPFARRADVDIYRAVAIIAGIVDFPLEVKQTPSPQGGMAPPAWARSDFP